jgi:hypothetical protein
MDEGQHMTRTVPRGILSPWGGLPDFCALVPIAWCASYAITMLVLGPRAGLAGTGYAIQIGLVLMAAPVLGAIGILAGRLAQRVPAIRSWAAGMTRWWWLAVLVVAALASCLAIAEILAARREALPPANPLHSTGSACVAWSDGCSSARVQFTRDFCHRPCLNHSRHSTAAAQFATG